MLTSHTSPSRVTAPPSCLQPCLRTVLLQDGFPGGALLIMAGLLVRQDGLARWCRNGRQDCFFFVQVVVASRGRSAEGGAGTAQGGARARRSPGGERRSARSSSDEGSGHEGDSDCDAGSAAAWSAGSEAQLGEEEDNFGDFSKRHYQFDVISLIAANKDQFNQEESPQPPREPLMPWTTVKLRPGELAGGALNMPTGDPPAEGRSSCRHPMAAATGFGVLEA